jgi:hypothetical protein
MIKRFAGSHCDMMAFQGDQMRLLLESILKRNRLWYSFGYFSGIIFPDRIGNQRVCDPEKA